MPLYVLAYLDEETGFVYLRGRYYDPAAERFVTEDPMKDGGNWYAYCGNDPVNKIDPTGFKKTKVTVTLPGGTNINATVENGVTRLFDGSRPPAGSVVHAANGKDYVMTGSGQGKSPQDIARELSQGAALWDALGIKPPEIKSSAPKPSIFDRIPDFYVISVGLSKALGVNGSVIIDKWGREYWSASPVGAGISSGPSGSVSAFWINTLDINTSQYKDYVNNYIKGWAKSYSGGAIIGMTIIRPKDSNLPEAIGFGLYTPQLGGSNGYTEVIPNSTPRPEYAKPH